MSELDKPTYIDAVRESSALLAETARKGLIEPVLTCPGWYVATLVAHLGEVQRFWALQARSRAQEAQSLPESAFESCPGLLAWFDGVDAGEPDLNHIPEKLVEWFEAGTSELLDAFQDVGPGEEIWHWSGDNRAITHMRNQAMEATVHRWDGQNAHGKTTPIDPAIALDGINQHFEVQLPAGRKQTESPAGAGETYHFHRTDGKGEWLVRFEGDDVVVTHEHAKGLVAVRGTVENLFLWLWNRIPADSLEVLGDRSMLQRYRELGPGL